MPVTFCHDEYLYNLPLWNKISDCMEGDHAVKASANQYLPMLEGHKADPDSYVRYVNGALWYGAARRVRESFISSIFRKDPSIVVPARLKPRLDNINGAGDNFYTFSKRVVSDVLTYGRIGLLVDFPAPLDENGNKVVPDPKDPAGTLPWIATYECRDIRSWRTKIRGGKTIVDQIILRENKIVPAEDEFGFKLERQYRILDLDETDQYRMRVFRTSDNGNDELIAQFEPTPDKGKRINYIPFIFIGPTDLRPDVTRSPLLDLVDAQVSWFKSSAECESARSKIAWPILWVATDQMPDAPPPIQVGGDQAMWLPIGGSLNIAEFRGDGIGALERALSQKEGYMAALGARMLEEPKRAAEAAETQYLKKSSENSILASVAMTTSDGLTAALKIACDWVAATGEVKAELNTDFFDAPVSPQTITALVAAVQAGYYTLNDFIHVMLQGEMIRPGTSIEEIRAELETEAPRLMGTPENLSDTSTQEQSQQGQQQPQQRAGNSSTPNVPDSRQPPSGTPRKASA